MKPRMLIVDNKVYEDNQIEDGIYYFKVVGSEVRSLPKHLLIVNTVLFIPPDKQVYYNIYFNLTLKNNTRLVNFLHSIGVKKEYEPYIVNTKDFYNRIGIVIIHNNYPINFVYKP